MPRSIVSTVLACGLVLGLGEAGAEEVGVPNPQRAAYLKAEDPSAAPAMEWSRRQRYEIAHYRLETNLPESSARYVGHLLEAIYDYYSRMFHASPSGHFDVQIFASFDDFASEMSTTYHHALRRGEGGGYISGLHAILLPWVTKVPGMPANFIHDPSAVLIHEGFHQFYDSIFNTQDPTWLNEGMATYFENATFDGRRLLDPGISPTKLTGMQDLFTKGKDEPLRRMMNVPHQDFNGQQYCEAWSFLFWVIWGDPLAAHRAKRQKQLVEYIQKMSDPASRTPQAFEQAMGIHLDDASQAWKSFVLSLNAADGDGGLGYLRPPASKRP